eukprot:1141334-Pelagomonas_calceolata.AAC.2
MAAGLTKGPACVGACSMEHGCKVQCSPPCGRQAACATWNMDERCEARYLVLLIFPSIKQQCSSSGEWLRGVIMPQGRSMGDCWRPTKAKRNTAAAGVQLETWTRDNDPTALFINKPH